MQTIYGLILSIEKLLETKDSETRDQATVTGAINSLKDIIAVFEDLVPGEFLICDSEGHVNSANWTTAQTFEYTNFNTKTPVIITREIGDEEKSKAYESNKNSVNIQTEENRWIEASIDPVDCQITL